jgi:hypothetical protein
VYFFLRTYKYKTSVLRIVWVITCVFITSVVASQTDVPVTDTVKTGTLSTEDSVIEQIEEPPPEVDEIPDADNQVYFKKKWMEGAGMDSVQLRHLPDSLLNALKAGDAFNYGNKKKGAEAIEPIAGKQGNKTTTREIDPPEQRKTISQAGWFQTLLWILIIGGFAAFLIIWLAGSNIGIFGKKRRSIADETNEEEITEDIFAINYQKEIDKAAASGNYRFAIRLMFLRLLKNMSERNVIRYKHDSTNMDYLLQLSNSSYYNDFFRLTRNYEYSWYGQFQVREEAYKVIRNDFDNLDRKLK